MATRPFQFFRKPPVSGLDVDGSPRRGAGRLNSASDDDDDERRHGHGDGEAAGVFRPEEIERADARDGKRGEDRRVRHAQVDERRERAQRGGDDVICNEQERPDDGDDLRAVAHAGVDAAAVRVVLADEDVVERDQAGDHAHGRDQPEGTVARHRKGEADDVRLGSTPVAVENGRGAFRVNVARAAGLVAENQRHTFALCPAPAGETDPINPLSSETGGRAGELLSSDREPLPLLFALTRLAVGLGPVKCPGRRCVVRPDPADVFLFGETRAGEFGSPVGPETPGH